MTQFGRSLWENADILVLVIVIEFWQFLTKTPLNVRIAVTVAGLYMVFRFFGAKREIDAYASAAPMEKEGKRVFVDDPRGSPGTCQAHRIRRRSALHSLPWQMDDDFRGI
jgi:hypothetical protein